MKTLQLNPLDNVAIAREPIGTDVPVGHKVAVRPIAIGEPILKYGQIIGVATQPITPGEHVHNHNLAVPTTTLTIPQAHEPELKAPPSTPISNDYFLGYLRPSGRVGTRNYLGILTTVNCSATVAKRIAAHFTPDRLAPFPNVDGVVALTHSTGCGMSSSGEAADLLRRTTAGYADHPNFAAVLLLGLGCEANQVTDLIPLTTANVRTATIQDEGGTKAAIAKGITEIESLLPLANASQRTQQPISALTIGLQCGGSDAWSGVTANPALGLAMDTLIRNGGTAILSETPEIFGAEHLLTHRANPDVAAQLLARIEWWKNYTALHRNTLDNNPSPGNKAGGLTTILEKSLGAVAKAGSSPLNEVILYAQRPATTGLIFMDSPGYDPVSATGQIASGANLLCFTTGRGSVFGAKPVPSLKLASNTALYRRMQDDMDINCGTILDTTETLSEVADRIYKTILATASGTFTKSEELGFGEEEFQPWILGAVL